MSGFCLDAKLAEAATRVLILHKSICTGNTLPCSHSPCTSPVHTPPCTQSSANSNHGACTQDLRPPWHKHAPLRTLNAQRSRSPRALTESLSVTLAGRFFGCLTASVVMGPRSPGHGGGVAVPFPKGARGAAAPDGTWERGPAPPARSPCAAPVATPCVQAPAQAPGSGGGS